MSMLESLKGWMGGSGYLKESVCGVGWGLCTLHTTASAAAAACPWRWTAGIWVVAQKQARGAVLPKPRPPDVESRHWRWLRRAQARVGEEASHVPGLWELPSREGRDLEKRLQNLRWFQCFWFSQCLLEVLSFTNGHLGGWEERLSALTASLCSSRFSLNSIPSWALKMQMCSRNFIFKQKDNGKVSLGFQRKRAFGSL